MLAFLGLVLVWAFKHSQCFTREAGIVWEEGPSHDLYRECPAVPYATYLHKTTYRPLPRKKKLPHICITTLTDEQSPSLWQRTMRCRNFDLVGHLTWPSRQAYAEKHGYSLIDYSSHIDSSRPPAWSKIKAVQSLMSQHEEPKPDNNTMTATAIAASGTIATRTTTKPCDWIFWMDADTVIMNSTIPVESFLPSDDDDDGVDRKRSSRSNSIDLIVTLDRRFTANSGAWLIRANSQWSHRFLQEWWDMRGWVRGPGLSLSGDNAAFGHLIQDKLQKRKIAKSNYKQNNSNKNDAGEKESRSDENDEQKQHIAFVPRCTFNSFGVYLQPIQARALHNSNNENDPKTTTTNELLSSQEWYQSPNFYHKGDFVAHASGIDQKEAGIRMLLKRAQ
ncbi:hypothetical protein ACA910_020256 [Epithemia clementina (nom. ined.)]